MMRGKSLIGLKILRDHEECAVPVTLLPCPRARTGPLTRRRRRRWPRRAGEGACRCDERLEFGAGEELPELSGRLPLAGGHHEAVPCSEAAMDRALVRASAVIFPNSPIRSVRAWRNLAVSP